MPELTCPACGQHGSTKDPNHFEPRGAWENRQVLRCRVCGAGMTVRRGLRGTRATLLAPDTWARFEQSWAAAAVTEAEAHQATAANMQELYNELVAALRRIRALPDEKKDARVMAVHNYLVSALVLTHELLVEAKGEPPAKATLPPQPRS